MITRNEWEYASTSREHEYHFWALGTSIQFAVIPPEILNKHVPADNGNGRWEVFRIPFKIFESMFRSYP